MKTTENSSNDFNDEVKRLFSGMLLGSLLLLISSAHLSGQCSITLTSGIGTDNQTVCINTPITNITYLTVVATGADFSGLPEGVTGSWIENVVTISGTPTESGIFTFTVTATGGTCESIIASGAITVNDILPVSVTIAADANPVCSETSVTFTATPVNGGTTPVYQWYLNGASVGSNQPSYTSATLSDEDNIYCVLTSSETCATGSPATSNTVTMDVNANLPVSISIAALPVGSICSGTSVTFTATPVNDGTTPVYQWYLNGASVGSNQPSYTSATLSDEDNIYCVLTSSETCATGSPATSNTVTMDVNANLPVSVSIAALPVGSICSGTSVTFTATPVNDGTTPVYQWYLNGASVGSNQPSYTSATLSDEDNIYCVLTSSETCATGSPATSNTVTMDVNANLPVSVSIAALPVGSICSGTSVTFTATPVNDGTTPVYQWYLNGASVGSNQPSYTSATLSDEDNIYCVLTSSETCATGSPATSNTVTMDVNANLPVSVSIATLPVGSICSGTSVTFTAIPVNDGTTPVYQWYLNGASVGSNQPSYTSATLSDEDNIYCVLTSSETCATGSPAISNTVTIDVNANLPVSVSIAALPVGSICSGTSVTFTATPVNDGTTPVYQWYLNGASVGSNQPSYTSATLSDEDNIYCVLTSNATCPTGNPATSNTVTMTVNPLPVVTFICSDSDHSFYYGTNVTFTAGGGTLYDFLVNGASVQSGANDTYSTALLTDGQVVSVIVTTALECSASSSGIEVNVINCADFSVSFATGWNWFSVNTLLPDMSLNSVLSSGFTNGDYIKNQTSFAFYSSIDGWVGSLSSIDPTDLYIIKVENATGVDICGIPVNTNSTPIPVVKGWNWVGYTPSFSLPLNDALNSLPLVTGDYIKNQTGYADYFGTSWFGSLVNMAPGEGYMLNLTNAGTLTYPDSPAKSTPEIGLNQPDNSFSPNKYEFNGSVTANVLVNDIPPRSEKDRLYAYVDDEIRGIANGMYLDFQDSYIFPLMIFSNKPEGEIVHFKYYNSENNKFYECLENIPFKTDMIISSPFKSFKMNVVSERKSAMDDASSDLQLTAYPNPFENILNIGFTVPELSDVRVTVSDQYGNILKVLIDQELNPDNYTIQWTCEAEPAGIYIIRIQAGNRFIVRKVLLIP